MDYGSRRFQAVAAVAVVALLGLAFVSYTTLGTSSTTTSSTTTQSTQVSFPGSSGGSSKTSSSSSSSTSSSTTTRTIVSSTSLPCVPGVGGYQPNATSSTSATSLPDYVPLFTSISSMTMFAQQVIVDQYGRINSSTIVATYNVTGRTQMQGTNAYVVRLSVTANETSYAIVNGSSNVGSATGYFDPEGDLLQFSQINLNQTGSAAIASAAPYLDWFNTELISPQQLASFSNPNVNTALNQTTVVLGPTTMNVTFARPNAIPYSVTQCGATTVVEDVMFAYGVVPGTSTPVITYYYSLGTDGTANEDLGYKILSITPA